MRLSSRQLESHLQQGLNPFYTLCGDEALGKRESLDLVRQTATRLGFEERHAFVVERNFNWQQIEAVANSVSLFSNQKLIEITIPSGKPGTEGATFLHAMVKNGVSDCCIVILLPSLDWRELKTAWVQSLETSTTFISLEEPSSQQLPDWLAKRLAKHGQSTDQETLQFLANQVEGNLLAAHQEIEKLSLLFPPGPVDGQAVREAVLNVSRYDPAQLGEAVLNGEVERTVRILQGLQDEGIPVITVMNPFLWVIKPLVKIKTAEQRGLALHTAMSEARLFGERQEQARKALGRFSIKQLEAALAKLSEIDKIAKGIRIGDPWLELSRLCFGLAKIQARKQRAS